MPFRSESRREDSRTFLLFDLLKLLRATSAKERYSPSMHRSIRPQPKRVYILARTQFLMSAHHTFRDSKTFAMKSSVQCRLFYEAPNQ